MRKPTWLQKESGIHASLMHRQPARVGPPSRLEESLDTARRSGQLDRFSNRTMSFGLRPRSRSPTLCFACPSVNQCAFDDKTEKAAGASGVNEDGACKRPVRLLAHPRRFHTATLRMPPHSVLWRAHIIQVDNGFEVLDSSPAY